MDSRIEELAAIILERAESSANAINSGAVPGQVDKATRDRYATYRRLQWSATEMLSLIHDYRVNNPELYK
jgi:hypothetical protein